MDFDAILQQAHEAASVAILEMFKSGKREHAFNCGFAWVTIDGTEALARHCRKMRESEAGKSKQFEHEYHHTYGDKGYPRGWQWWGPGAWPNAETAGVPVVYAQDMDFKAAGARAFQKVLGEHGIKANVGTRLD